jgi:hypothetical protein
MRRGYLPAVRNEVRVVEGVDRIRAKMERNHMLALVHAEVSVVLRETPKVDMTQAKLAGSPEALRGLPVVARNVRGAIPGTQPEHETVRRLSRNGR